MNDSSTGGPLLPSSAAPDDDEVLTDFMQSVVVGITDLPGTLVRPRWQPEPPTMPRRGQTWAAVAVTNRSGDGFPAVEHDSAGDGTDTLVQNEEFVLETSFYGPRAESTAALLRDGLAVAQNREQLSLADVVFVICGPMSIVPSVVKEMWQMRVDMNVRFRRQIRRTYPVLNLLSAAGTITSNGNLTTPFSAS
jgi:hypothetical protein